MGDYKAHGQKMWKILTNTFFTSYPPFEINDCSGNIMYGGPGKTSKVSFFKTKNFVNKKRMKSSFLSSYQYIRELKLH